MSVCCHKCHRILEPHEKHRCVTWVHKTRAFLNKVLKKIASFVAGKYWKCNCCGVIILEEKESFCRFCEDGEMIYQGD